MKHKTRACLAVSVASVMACGLFTACDLVTTDATKDYEQVVAEVNIAENEDFKGNGSLASYAGVVGTENIYKRDMVATFVSSGYNVMSQYGWTYRDTFDAIKDSLINRAVYVQYAKVYFLSAKNEDGTAKFTDEDGKAYTAAGYTAAVNAATGSDLDKTLGGLAYFLTQDEENKALYDLRVSFNSSLDSIEEGIIDAEDDDASSVTPRTLPTGVNTENEDYCPLTSDGKSVDYNIYTGTESDALLGSYEKVEDSTAISRSLEEMHSKCLGMTLETRTAPPAAATAAM